LAKKLKELAGEHHLADILTIVRADVSKMEFHGDTKQVPQVATTLLKKLRLIISGFSIFLTLTELK
jgi:hypothetical protein